MCGTIHLAIVALSLIGQEAPRDAIWDKATRKATFGDLTVGIMAVRRGKILLKNLRKDTVSNEELLSVYVGIQNKSETKKYDYRGWSTKTFDRESRLVAKAGDEFDNVYKRISFDIFTEVTGQLKEGESVYPEKLLKDVLIFELPIERAKELRLTLPGEAIGERGPIYLKAKLGAPDKEGFVFMAERERQEEARAREIEAKKAEAQAQMEAEAKKTPEDKAAEKLKEAERLRDAGQPDGYGKLLKEIVAKYPDTKAGKEAADQAAAKNAADAKAQAEKDEKAAAAKLKSAEAILKEGKVDSYRKILKQIVDKYPDTAAGKKAAKLLK